MARPTQRLKRKPELTHEGAPAPRLTDEQRLRRSLMSCLLFEKTFYEEGEAIAERLDDLAGKVAPEKVAAMAVEARQRMKIRHAPMVLCRALARRGELKPGTLTACLQRADEPAEFLALLWEKGHTMVPAAVKKGVNAALATFDEYQLAKYDRRDSPVKLRDVFRACRPKPKTPEQEALWGRAVKAELATPDTWEVALSAAEGEEEKRAVWQRLLAEKRLGAMALLRNLRNMKAVGIAKASVADALAQANFARVLPFRFLAAARSVPDWEDLLDAAMLRVKPEIALAGRTVIVVDVSGSMEDPLSARGTMMAMDAACGIAILARDCCDDVGIYSFSNGCLKIPPRRGMALRDAIIGSQEHGATWLGRALERIKSEEPEPNLCRLLVVTDEEAHDAPIWWGKSRYCVNVRPYQSGVGYGAVTHIDGFSERIFDFIVEAEKQ